MVITTGRDFGVALCQHFGLPLDQVSGNIEMTTATNEFFGAKVFICLTADDMAGIAARMGGKALDWAPVTFIDKPGKKNKGTITPGLHFDTWMRARTDAAHAAYMAGHADGGKDDLLPHFHPQSLACGTPRTTSLIDWPDWPQPLLRRMVFASSHAAK